MRSHEKWNKFIAIETILILKIPSVVEVIAAVSKLTKSGVIRLTSSKIFFIVAENQVTGGANLLCELPQVGLAS